ncbi:hypothetical protein MSAS_22040 [Mycobacterium saskatchewanense]|nr:hypothetical protein [Mycobacterium saskatchewanense]BBX63030.1 hypothetical protein MSAS_22040 [Mycobacterium saskatchewanense]
MSDPNGYLPVLAALERLRGDHEAWAKLRRLAIVAPCCKDRRPMIEVMQTDPPCVLVGQLSYGHTDLSDADRKPWAGARAYEEQGAVWLTAFEQMAERGLPQFVWCRHRRWAVSASDVVTRRGQHVLPLPDAPRPTLT